MEGTTRSLLAERKPRGGRFTRSGRRRGVAACFIAAILFALMLAMACPAIASASGVLVYQGEGSWPPAWGSQMAQYSWFGAAAGLPVEYAVTLPADLSAYDCVILPANGMLDAPPFTEATKAALKTYLQGGGKVLAEVDRAGLYPLLGSISNMNGLAAYVGSGMSFNEVDNMGYSYRDGPAEVVPGPLTEGVTGVVQWDMLTSVNAGANGTMLLRTPQGADMVAAEPIGSGLLVMSACIHVFSDADCMGSGNQQLSNNIAHYVCAPPITANDDSYGTKEDTALTVDAPGVLSNDTVPPGSTPSVQLVSGPSDGALELNADGSFTYTPPANWSGTTSFTYNVTAGGATAGPGTVKITVKPVDDAPTITSFSAQAAPAPIGSEIAATLKYADGDEGDTHTYEIDWSDGTKSTGTATGGEVTAKHIYASPGVYGLTATITDQSGLFATKTYESVVVYDAGDGFVTGGGWFNSPASAYPGAPTAAGRAAFSLRAKYVKGKTVPTGTVDFQLPAANLSFVSTEYQWLVVTGTKAQFKGVGTLNGEPGYGFVATCVDDAPDTMRMQIVRLADDAVIYDNQAGGTPIGAGNLVLHK